MGRFLLPPPSLPSKLAAWRAHRNLTFTVGVRYSHFVPTYTSGNNIANFDPSLYNPAKAVTVTAAGLIAPNSGNMYNGLIRAGDGVPSDQVGRVPIANTAALALIPTGAPRGLYPSYNLFMPRFGFAWNLFGNSKTALRGGFASLHETRSPGVREPSPLGAQSGCVEVAACPTWWGRVRNFLILCERHSPLPSDDARRSRPLTNWPYSLWSEA